MQQTLDEFNIKRKLLVTTEKICFEYLFISYR